METQETRNDKMIPSKTTPVPEPTWYDDIRFMFTETDIKHMRNVFGLDLASYHDVRASASDIYAQVATGRMPPPTLVPVDFTQISTGKSPHYNNNAWPKAWITTFLNWMQNGYPKGGYVREGNKSLSQSTAVALEIEESVVNKIALKIQSKATRIRKEITTLSQTELDDLKKAFSGIMAKEPSDPNSYFVQAGYHWFPPPTYCQHVEPGFLPWHRAYLVSFENALRSVPGCENVTVPYWDITKPFPEVLKSAPFDSYTLPKDIGEDHMYDPKTKKKNKKPQIYDKGYRTKRFPYLEIEIGLSSKAVTEDILRAFIKTDWEDFNGLFGGANNNTIINAHNGGHHSIGPTMQEQEVAAFDPIFWFFHSNWDRLFWKWQKQMKATTLNGLLSTINKQKDPTSYEFFTIRALEELKPFPSYLNTISIIDSENSLGIDYQEPETSTKIHFLPKTQRSVPASQKFSVDTERVNVRVQGINRLKIPGSFSVHLQKDGKTIASRAFFQPKEVEKCETCIKNAIVHFDFELPLKEVSDGQLGIVVEPVDKSFVGDRFPHNLMGNPTIDVCLLMKTE